MINTLMRLSVAAKAFIDIFCDKKNKALSVKDKIELFVEENKYTFSEPEGALVCLISSLILILIFCSFGTFFWILSFPVSFFFSYLTARISRRRPS